MHLLRSLIKNVIIEAVSSTHPSKQELQAFFDEYIELFKRFGKKFKLTNRFNIIRMRVFVFDINIPVFLDTRHPNAFVGLTDLRFENIVNDDIRIFFGVSPLNRYYLTKAQFEAIMNVVDTLEQFDTLCRESNIDRTRRW